MKDSRITLNILSSSLNVLVMVLIVFVLLKAGEVAYEMGFRVFTEPAMDASPGRDVAVRVEKEMSGLELGSVLEEKKLVDNGVLFAIQLRLSAYAGKLKAGTYTLNTSQTAVEMIRLLAGEGTEDTEE
ncbi:MAG: endolytic transglycosylase MltG [Lachnospiraceae bacterium]|nr:endolytic transglycosylase MltG [Lachnospiraceae bacterium]MCI9646045.1 endolytic transglycosylase MltG [Lachnospiraceae bacterium]